VFLLTKNNNQMAAVLEDKKIAVADFLTFDELNEDAYYEPIEGNIAKKSAPIPKYQRVIREILVAIRQTVSSTKKGEVFCAPIDVFLDRFNAYQLDIVYVSK
jgi:Uma2 family endonuclease